VAVLMALAVLASARALALEDVIVATIEGVLPLVEENAVFAEQRHRQFVLLLLLLGLFHHSRPLGGVLVGASVGVGVSFEQNVKSRYAASEGTLAVFKLHCSVVCEHSYDPQVASLLQ
jgi:hypothetical protein